MYICLNRRERTGLKNKQDAAYKCTVLHVHFIQYDDTIGISRLWTAGHPCVVPVDIVPSHDKALAGLRRKQRMILFVMKTNAESHPPVSAIRKRLCLLVHVCLV